MKCASCNKNVRRKTSTLYANQRYCRDCYQEIPEIQTLTKMKRPDYSEMSSFDDYKDLSNVMKHQNDLENDGQEEQQTAILDPVYGNDSNEEDEQVNKGAEVLDDPDLIDIFDDSPDEEEVVVNEKEPSGETPEFDLDETDEEESSELIEEVTEQMDLPTSEDLEDFHTGMEEFEPYNSQTDSRRTEIVDLDSRLDFDTDIGDDGQASFQTDIVDLNEEVGFNENPSDQRSLTDDDSRLPFENEIEDMEPPIPTEIVDLNQEAGQSANHDIDDPEPIAGKTEEDDQPLDENPSTVIVLEQEQLAEPEDADDAPVDETPPVFRLRQSQLLKVIKSQKPLAENFIKQHHLKVDEKGVLLLGEKDLKTLAHLNMRPASIAGQAVPGLSKKTSRNAANPKANLSDEKIIKICTWIIIGVLCLLPFTLYFKWSWVIIDDTRYEQLKERSSFFDRTFDLPFKYRSKDSWFRWYGRRVLIPMSYKDAEEKYGMFTGLLYVNSGDDNHGDDLMMDDY